MRAKTEDVLKRARRNAYAILRMRPRSEWEIGDRLRQKGYPPAAIQAVVDDLKRLGEIDDGKFAKFWIESRRHLKPVGDRMLRQELRTKGVSESVIEEVLASRGAAYNEYEAAREMAAERLSQLEKIDSRRAIKRLYDFLARRGFGFDTIEKIVDELKAKTSIGKKVDRPA